MIALIDVMRDRFGVEGICRVLAATESGFVTARGYRAAKTRPPSARQLSDELLGAEIARLHAENYGVYGARKMHALMRRQGWDKTPAEVENNHYADLESPRLAPASHGKP